MDRDKLQKLILDSIKSFGKKRIRRRQLFNMIGHKGLDYEDFKGVLTEMEHAGTIVRMKGRRFQLPEKSGAFTGVFTLSRNGGGYIKTADGESIYVHPRDTGGAVSGDAVQARMSRRKRPGFSPTAKIVAIVERSTQPTIGVFRTTGTTSYIVPRDERIAGNILVRPGGENGAEDGDLVVTRIDMPETGFSRPVCTITEVLGDPDAPGVDVLAIVRRYGLSTAFPEDVEAEAERIPADLGRDVLERRTDLRETVTFTIDPEDAKDFDDAISIEKTGDGCYHLGVHIADVAHYIGDGSAIDREAAARAMSCYLVDRVIPMLPERLSNELCSLRPDEDRLTKSVFAVIDPHGVVLSHDIANTVIRSRKRLTYGQVQSYIDGKDAVAAVDIGPEVGEALRLLSELTDILLERREERGALDFTNPEAHVILDERGKPVDIVRREQHKSNVMIEEAMILANIITARALGTRKAHFLYRIHEDPDATKLASFAETAQALGYDFKASRADDHDYIRAFLQSLKGIRHERTLNMLLLRSMKKARYSPENAGHYGLALPVYGHFTSPIRRYPDLILHRQLDAFFLNGGGRSAVHDYGYYDALGDSVSGREIVTVSAERDSVKMKTAEFMKTHLGEEFDGTITGIIPIGFFVELDRYFAEGLVHVSTLLNDYYIIDKAGVALVGRSTGSRFMLGNRVRVAVASADKDKGEVDFVLVEGMKRGRGRKKR